MRATTGLRAARHALAAVLSIGVFLPLGLSACSSNDGCDSAKDCASGYRCEAHVCVLPPPPIRYDSGVHEDAAVTPPDSGVVDTGVDSGVVDTGVVDTGVDGGTVTPPDSGLPPVDGGVITGDAGTLPSGGYAHYDELSVNGVVTPFGDALFEDRSNTTYTLASQRFSAPDGSGCTLSVERLQSGTPTGISAQRVVFRHDSGATRELLPDPVRPGHFTLPGTATAGFFDVGNVSFETSSNGAPGTLADFTIMASSPGFLQASQPALSPVTIASGVHLAWIGAQASVVVELADAPRTVVLTCSPTFGVSSYDLPMDALRAWVAAQPAHPASLELRNDIVRRVAIPLEGGGTLPATFRVARGTRWDVTF